MFTFSSQYIAPLCQRIYGCVCGTFLPCVLGMFRKEILTAGGRTVFDDNGPQIIIHAFSDVEKFLKCQINTETQLSDN